jgi:cobalt-precorrin 5A hydrolase
MIAVVCLTPAAADASRCLAAALGASLHLHVLAGPTRQENSFERLAACLDTLWPQVEGLVVVAPTGAVVRSIAPLLVHKTIDPGVVVVDALARWAIPLVGGHEGGANRLAQRVANLLGAEPVVTTASEALKDVVVGIGCRRGATGDKIVRAVSAALLQVGIALERVRTLATASPKRDEPGLLEAASILGLPLHVVHDLEIRSRRRPRRTAAARRVGLPAVSHPAALAAGRRTSCLLQRFRSGPVMISLAREHSGWWGSAPEIPPTAPRRR